MRRHRFRLQPEQRQKLRNIWPPIPALAVIYRFKQRLCYLLLTKHRTRKRCAQLIPAWLRALEQLKQVGLAPLVALGQTLYTGARRLLALWRFTRSNGITEGFHTKMEALTRQAYGFRNFENYRKRVNVLCA
jgi:transposase